MQTAKPERLPVASIRWEALIPLIGQANRALAGYGALLSTLPDADILLAPMATQEAVLSSRIEGTQASFGEVLKADAGESPNAPALELDVQEITNYRLALREAEQQLQTRPFSLNLLRSLHATLMAGVRGENKSRGEFRRIQNWIGRPGSAIEAADFVPPAPHELAAGLDAWERYYHAEAPDALVQLAVVHAQFEFLHPFLDGNGRLGRILVPLFLSEKKLLTRPAFYLSAYLEKHRDEYIGRLRALGREADGWQRWCEFFLAALTEQAESNGRQVGQILELHKTYRQRAVELTHSEFAIMLVDAVFARPIFSSTQMVAMPHMPSRTVINTLLGRLASDGMLSIAVAGRGRRPQIWACDELITLCERYE